MFSQLVLSPGLKPWSQLNSPVPTQVGMLTATAGDEFATVNLNILPLWMVDGPSARSKQRAQARRRFRKQPGYGRVSKPCGHHKALTVPHRKKLWLFEYDGIDEDLRGVCLRISLLGFLLVLLYFT
jgi:hypothetical protein